MRCVRRLASGLVREAQPLIEGLLGFRAGGWWRPAVGPAPQQPCRPQEARLSRKVQPPISRVLLYILCRWDTVYFHIFEFPRSQAFFFGKDVHMWWIRVLLGRHVLGGQTEVGRIKRVPAKSLSTQWCTAASPSVPAHWTVMTHVMRYPFLAA